MSPRMMEKAQVPISVRSPSIGRRGPHGATIRLIDIDVAHSSIVGGHPNLLNLLDSRPIIRTGTILSRLPPQRSHQI